MRLLPYDTFTIHTTDPLPIVLERLKSQIEPEQPVRSSFSRNHAPYQGTISETGFQISRIIHNRNSFIPLIQGRFESSPRGTTIRMTMRLHPFVIVFVVCWYLIWYGFFFPIWLTGAMPTAFALQFLGLPIAILFAFWAQFWAEVFRSRQDLLQIILAQVNPRQRFRNFYSWIPNAIIWSVVLLGLAFTFLQANGTFHPLTSAETESLDTVSCSQHPDHSPICNFSLIHTINGHPTASALAISVDGQTLVSGGNDKAIKVWDLKTGQLKTTLQSDSGRINAVAISPDNKIVVSGSADRMVRIWDLTSNHRPLMLAGHSEDVNLVAITPDGKTVISGSYGAIKQWDLATGQLKATFPKIAKSETKIGSISIINDEATRFRPLDINPSSNTALISDLKLVDLTTNQAKTIPTNKVKTFADYFLSAHLSPDGKLAALQFGNSFKKFQTRLKVWNLTTGALQAETSATFSHDMFADLPLALSRELIFGSINKQLKVWNLQTAKLEAVLDTGWISYLTVTPDGKLLAGLTSSLDSDRIQIQVWQNPSK